jgi:tetratricopeptide (TPR) repeat protein
VPSSPSGPSNQREEPANLRLDSWKEIASYLGRGERTVKRWECDRALPVYRLPGGGRGSVYAFTSELDEWLLSAKAIIRKLDEDANEPVVIQGKAESGDPVVVSPEGEARLASMNLTASSAVGGTHGGGWRISAYLLLPAGLALAAILIALFRIAGAPAFAFPRVQPNISSPSDAEKQIAHELYLRGRFEWSKRTPDSLNRALDDFTQALVQDPDNALTYAGLADTYNLLREYSVMPDNEAYSRAIAASKRAIELDDSLAEAHRSLAYAEVWGNWDFQDGKKEFRRTIELNPRDPLSHLWFANAFAGPGWYPLCLKEIDRAQELNPASPSILADKGAMLFVSGQRKEGIELLKQVERTAPEFLSPHRYLAEDYMAMRDYPDFLLESETMAKLNRDPVLQATNTAARDGYRRDGERGLLNALYAAKKKFHDQGMISGTNLARICVRLGKKEEALQLLREDYLKHRAEFISIRADLVLADLRGEPEFQELIGHLHLPAPEAADVDVTVQDSQQYAMAAR